MKSSGATWTDVGIFWATLGGVIVTFLAVLVALFGPRLQERWKRPKITVDSIGGMQARSELWPLVVRLMLCNQQGRDTARDVEVFASLTRDGAIVADQATLDFEDPTTIGSSGRSVATVPPGFAREVSLLVLEPVWDSEGWLRAGTVAFFRPGTVVLRDQATYKVLIAVTGANFDAVHYVGHFRLDVDFDADEVPTSIEFQWIDFERSKTGDLRPTLPWRSKPT
jgi:hypothetical protein